MRFCFNGTRTAPDWRAVSNLRLCFNFDYFPFLSFLIKKRNKNPYSYRDKKTRFPAPHSGPFGTRLPAGTDFPARARSLKRDSLNGESNYNN